MKNLILLLMFLATFFGCTKKNEVASKKILNIYSWSNYISPEIIKAFEEKTNATINFNYFASNEELLAKLQAGAQGYDLIVPTGYLIPALKELKLIEPLGKLDWPELQSLNVHAKAPYYDPNHEYSIPYEWGTTGLAVNRKKVKVKVDSLAWIFDHPELKGEITLLDDPAGVVGIALKYLGYSFNEDSDEALEKVKVLLKKQKTLVKAYTPEVQPILESGESSISHSYSGDTLQVKYRKNPDIDFIFPKEGGEFYIDNLAIPKGAKERDLALEFIRLTLQQKIAILQTKHLFYSPVINITDIEELGPLKVNPAIFPPAELLKNYEEMRDNPKRAQKIEKLWTELKS